MNPAEYGRHVGVSRQNINNVEAGGVKHPRFIDKLAKAIGTTVDDLLAGRSPNAEPAQELTQRQVISAPQSRELLPAAIPRTRGAGRPVGSVVIASTGIRASMGSGADRPEADGAVSEMVVDEGWLRRNCTFTAPENLSLISGVGDSMRPTFEDGDALLIDLGIREVRVDAVYCLALNDELYVKRLQRRPDGTVVMISDNRAYDSYQIQPKRDRLDVLGRVVMTWNARRL